MGRASIIGAAPTVADVLGCGELACHEAALARRAAVPAGAQAPAPARVAVVNIMGPLMQRPAAGLFEAFDGYSGIVARFEAALASDAAGVLLRIDSPGGVVAGLFEAVRAMTEAREASGKRVVAFADELAASAAYALATVADTIVVPASGQVGSVGVIAMHATQARALERDGVDVRVFRSGAQKAEGTAVEPLTDGAAKRAQGRVDALAATFTALVAEARGIDAADVAKREGALLGAADAVRYGFADRVGSLTDAAAIAAGLVEQAPAAQAMAWEDYSVEARSRMQGAEPELFAALLAEHRERVKAETYAEHMRPVLAARAARNGGV